MLITRTPLRVSLLGGGTDLPAVYSRGGGATVGAALAAWIDVAVRPRLEHEPHRFVVACGGYETADCVGAIAHPIVREALRFTQTDEPLEIHSMASVPAGTGLGSSSSFTVGLLHALYARRDQAVTPMQLARDAFCVEAERVGCPIGRQDHAFAALGGLRELRFDADGGVRSRVLSGAGLARLQSSFLLFRLAGTRSAAEVLRRLDLAADHRQEILGRMRDSVSDLVREIEDGCSLARIGEMLHRGWILKRELGASTPEVDAAYALAREHGALGGKLLGAGQTGTLLLVAPVERAPALRRALAGQGELRFAIDPVGSRVLLRAP